MEKVRKNIIEVKRAESALLVEAERIEKEAEEKRKWRSEAATEKVGRLITDPFLELGTPEACQILDERDRMKARYQRELRLDTPPILIPPVSGEVVIHGGRNYSGFRSTYSSYSNSREAPIPEELKDAFLRRVPTFRDGERLYVWQGTYYRFMPDSEVKARIKSVLHQDFMIPNPVTMLNSVLALLKLEDSIVGRPDSCPWLVAVRNGVLDLRNMALLPASPSHFVTQFLDVCWEGWMPCPVFTAFLERTTRGDSELTQRLLEAIGYLLTADNRPKRFVVFQGAGDCGKTMLGKLISSYFVRGDSTALADYQFGERFGLASVANAHFCLCMDLSDGTIEGKAVSMLKQITGGDLVSIEAKGKDAFADYINCKILFGTNNPIKLKSRDQAFARRILLIPFFFPLSDAEKDRDLLDKLKRERSGILYLALTAYRAVVERGFVFTGEERFGFTAEHIVLENAPPNSVELFARTCCVLDESAFSSTEALHVAFQSFCESGGLPGISDRAAFSRALNACMRGQIIADKRRVSGVPTNGYKGIRLRE